MVRLSHVLIFSSIGAALVVLISIGIEYVIQDLDSLLVPCQHGTSYNRISNMCNCAGTPFTGKYCGICNCAHGYCMSGGTTKHVSSIYGCRCPFDTKRFGFLCNLCFAADNATCKGECLDGFYGAKCDKTCVADINLPQLLSSNAHDDCKQIRLNGGICNICSGHGTCDEGDCVCDTHYFDGIDGKCSRTCTPSANGICSGHGACKLNGNYPSCLCEYGYRGVDCSVPCPGMNITGTSCNGHGNCLASYDNEQLTLRCACNQKFRGDACEIECPGEITACSGHGECDDVGVCTCNSIGNTVGWMGPACNCTDFITCGGNGNCDANGACQCFGNFDGNHCEQCKKHYWGSQCNLFCDPNGITEGDIVGCYGRGRCTLINADTRDEQIRCTCLDSAKTIVTDGAVNIYRANYEELENCKDCTADYLPLVGQPFPSGIHVPCQLYCDASTCNFQGTCNQAWGTPGESLCQCNRAHVDDDNFCLTCETNWYPQDVETGCVNFCIADGALPAECDTGDIECVHCSGNGICNGEGKCVCDDGFTGDECNVECTGDNGLVCSGHGQCIMNDLQKLLQYELEYAPDSGALFSCVCDPQDPYTDEERRNFAEAVQNNETSGVLDPAPTKTHYGEMCEFHCKNPPWLNAEMCNGIGDCEVNAIRDDAGDVVSCFEDADCGVESINRIISSAVDWSVEKGPFCHKSGVPISCPTSKLSVDECDIILSLQRPLQARSKQCMKDASCREYLESNDWFDWCNDIQTKQNPLATSNATLYCNLIDQGQVIDPLCAGYTQQVIDNGDSHSVSDHVNYCYEKDKSRFPFLMTPEYRFRNGVDNHDAVAEQFVQFIPDVNFESTAFCEKQMNKLNVPVDYVRTNQLYLCNETIQRQEACNVEVVPLTTVWSPFIVKCGDTHEVFQDLLQAIGARRQGCVVIEDRKDTTDATLQTLRSITSDIGEFCNNHDNCVAGSCYRNTCCGVEDTTNCATCGATCTCILGATWNGTHCEASDCDWQDDIGCINSVAGDICSHDMQCQSSACVDFTCCDGSQSNYDNFATCTTCIDGSVGATCANGICPENEMWVVNEGCVMRPSRELETKVQTLLDASCTNARALFPRCEVPVSACDVNGVSACNDGDTCIDKDGDAICETTGVLNSTCKFGLVSERLSYSSYKCLADFGDHACTTAARVFNWFDYCQQQAPVLFHDDFGLAGLEENHQPSRIRLHGTGDMVQFHVKTKGLLQSAALAGKNGEDVLFRVYLHQQQIQLNEIKLLQACPLANPTCNDEWVYEVNHWMSMRVTLDYANNKVTLEYDGAIKEATFVCDSCSHTSLTDLYIEQGTSETHYDEIIYSKASAVPTLHCDDYAFCDFDIDYRQSCIDYALHVTYPHTIEPQGNIQATCAQRFDDDLYGVDSPASVQQQMDALDWAGYCRFATELSEDINCTGFTHQSLEPYAGACDVWVRYIDDDASEVLSNLQHDWQQQCLDLTDAFVPQAMKDACVPACYKHFEHYDQCGLRDQLFSSNVDIPANISGCDGVDWLDFCHKAAQNKQPGVCSAIECDCRATRNEGMTGDACELHCPLAGDGSPCGVDSNVGVCIYTTEQEAQMDIGPYPYEMIELAGECQCYGSEGTSNCDRECAGCDNSTYDGGQVGICDTSRGMCQCLPPFTKEVQLNFTTWKGEVQMRLAREYGLPETDANDQLRIRMMQGKEVFTRQYLDTTATEANWTLVYDAFQADPSPFSCAGRPCTHHDFVMLGNLADTSFRYNYDCGKTCPVVDEATKIPCNGHGVCAITGSCVCDTARVIRGTDATSGSTFSINVFGGESYESSEFMVSKLDQTGYRGEDCSIKCPGFDEEYQNMMEVCSGHGVCNMDGECQCENGFVGDTCQFTCPFTEGKPLCSGHGSCDLGEITIDLDAFGGFDSTCEYYANNDVCDSYSMLHSMPIVNVADMALEYEATATCKNVSRDECLMWGTMEVLSYVETVSIVNVPADMTWQDINVYVNALGTRLLTVNEIAANQDLLQQATPMVTAAYDQISENNLIATDQYSAITSGTPRSTIDEAQCRAAAQDIGVAFGTTNSSEVPSGCVLQSFEQTSGTPDRRVIYNMSYDGTCTTDNACLEVLDNKRWVQLGDNYGASLVGNEPSCYEIQINYPGVPSPTTREACEAAATELLSGQTHFNADSSFVELDSGTRATDVRVEYYHTTEGYADLRMTERDCYAAALQFGATYEAYESDVNTPSGACVFYISQNWVRWKSYGHPYDGPCAEMDAACVRVRVHRRQGPASYDECVQYAAGAFSLSTDNDAPEGCYRANGQVYFKQYSTPGACSSTNVCIDKVHPSFSVRPSATSPDGCIGTYVRDTLIHVDYVETPFVYLSGDASGVSYYDCKGITVIDNDLFVTWFGPIDRSDLPGGCIALDSIVYFNRAVSNMPCNKRCIETLPNYQVSDLRTVSKSTCNALNQGYAKGTEIQAIGPQECAMASPSTNQIVEVYEGTPDHSLSQHECYVFAVSSDYDFETVVPLSFYELVVSGAPDLSVSVAECEAYADANGYVKESGINGNTYNSLYYPAGCHYKPPYVYYNSDFTNDVACGSGSFCIQRPSITGTIRIEVTNDALSGCIKQNNIVRYNVANNSMSCGFPLVEVDSDEPDLSVSVAECEAYADANGYVKESGINGYTYNSVYYPAGCHYKPPYVYYNSEFTNGVACGAGSFCVQKQSNGACLQRQPVSLNQFQLMRRKHVGAPDQVVAQPECEQYAINLRRDFLAVDIATEVSCTIVESCADNPSVESCDGNPSATFERYEIMSEADCTAIGSYDDVNPEHYPSGCATLSDGRVAYVTNGELACGGEMQFFNAEASNATEAQCHAYASQLTESPFYEQSSGAPVLSVTQEECETYAETNGYVKESGINGYTYNTVEYPAGCFHRPPYVYYNSDFTSDVACGAGSFCVKKPFRGSNNGAAGCVRQGHEVFFNEGLIEVSSGAPDLSVTQEECETYAETNGYVKESGINGYTYNSVYYPAGCHYKPPYVYYNSDFTNGVACSAGTFCIQRDNTIHIEPPIYEASSGAPDVSMSQAECEAYAAANGYDFDGQFNNVQNPRGCFAIPSQEDAFYNSAIEGIDCSETNPCIQKGSLISVRASACVVHDRNPSYPSGCVAKEGGELVDFYFHNPIRTSFMGDLIAVQSGAPDDSVTKEECETYATDQGMAFQTVASGPRGCFQTDVYVNFNDVSSEALDDCTEARPCIQRNRALRAVFPVIVTSGEPDGSMDIERCERYARDHPAERFYETSSGAPNLSVAQVECEAYADANGYVKESGINGYTYNSVYYPAGCHYKPPYVYYNSDFTNDVACGAGSFCVQKTNEWLGTVDVDGPVGCTIKEGVVAFNVRDYTTVGCGDQYYEADSGAPDLSISVAECETYADANGYVKESGINGYTYNSVYYPAGCHYKPPYVYYNSDFTNGVACGSGSFCIQKHSYGACLQLPSVASPPQYGAPIEKVSLPWVVEDTNTRPSGCYRHEGHLRYNDNKQGIACSDEHQCIGTTSVFANIIETNEGMPYRGFAESQCEVYAVQQGVPYYISSSESVSSAIPYGCYRFVNSSGGFNLITFNPYEGAMGECGYTEETATYSCIYQPPIICSDEHPCLEPEQVNVCLQNTTKVAVKAFFDIESTDRPAGCSVQDNVIAFNHRQTDISCSEDLPCLCQTDAPDVSYCSERALPDTNTAYGPVQTPTYLLKSTGMPEATMSNDACELYAHSHVDYTNRTYRYQLGTYHLPFGCNLKVLSGEVFYNIEATGLPCGFNHTSCIVPRYHLRSASGTYLVAHTHGGTEYTETTGIFVGVVSGESMTKAQAKAYCDGHDCVGYGQATEGSEAYNAFTSVSSVDNSFTDGFRQVSSHQLCNLTIETAAIQESHVGLPDGSISPQECQHYAEAKGYAWGGAKPVVGSGSHFYTGRSQKSPQVSLNDVVFRTTNRYLTPDTTITSAQCQQFATDSDMEFVQVNDPERRPFCSVAKAYAEQQIVRYNQGAPSDDNTLSDAQCQTAGETMSYMLGRDFYASTSFSTLDDDNFPYGCFSYLSGDTLQIRNNLHSSYRKQACKSYNDLTCNQGNGVDEFVKDVGANCNFECYEYQEVTSTKILYNTNKAKRETCGDGDDACIGIWDQAPGAVDKETCESMANYEETSDDISTACMIAASNGECKTNPVVMWTDCEAACMQAGSPPGCNYLPEFVLEEGLPTVIYQIDEVLEISDYSQNTDTSTAEECEQMARGLGKTWYGVIDAIPSGWAGDNSYFPRGCSYRTNSQGINVNLEDNVIYSTYTINWNTGKCRPNEAWQCIRPNGSPKALIGRTWYNGFASKVPLQVSTPESIYDVASVTAPISVNDVEQDSECADITAWNSQSYQMCESFAHKMNTQIVVYDTPVQDQGVAAVLGLMDLQLQYMAEGCLYNAEINVLLFVTVTSQSPTYAPYQAWNQVKYGNPLESYQMCDDSMERPWSPNIHYARGCILLDHFESDVHYAKVSSGSNADSVDQKQCELYALMHGYEFQIQNDATTAPSGCYEVLNLVYYNAQTSPAACSTSTPCIQQASRIDMDNVVFYNTDVGEYNEQTPCGYVKDINCPATQLYGERGSADFIRNPTNDYWQDITNTPPYVYFTLEDGAPVLNMDATACEEYANANGYPWEGSDWISERPQGCLHFAFGDFRVIYNRGPVAGYELIPHKNTCEWSLEQGVHCIARRRIKNYRDHLTEKCRDPSVGGSDTTHPAYRAPFEEGHLGPRSSNRGTCIQKAAGHLLPVEFDEEQRTDACAALCRGENGCTHFSIDTVGSNTYATEMQYYGTYAPLLSVGAKCTLYPDCDVMVDDATRRFKTYALEDIVDQSNTERFVKNPDVLCLNPSSIGIDHKTNSPVIKSMQDAVCDDGPKYTDYRDGRCKAADEKPRIPITFYTDYGTASETTKDLDCQVQSETSVICAQCNCAGDYTYGHWSSFECETCQPGFGKTQCRELCPGYDGENDDTMCGGFGKCLYGSEEIGVERIFQLGTCTCGQDFAYQARQSVPNLLIRYTDNLVNTVQRTAAVSSANYANEIEAQAACSQLNDIDRITENGYCVGVLYETDAWYLDMGPLDQTQTLYAQYYEKTSSTATMQRYTVQEREFLQKIVGVEEFECADPVSIALAGKDVCNHFSSTTDSCTKCDNGWSGKNCRNVCQKCLVQGICDETPSDIEDSVCRCPSNTVGLWEHQCCPIGFRVENLLAWQNKPQREINRVQIPLIYDPYTDNVNDASYYCKECPGMENSDWLNPAAGVKVCGGKDRGTCANNAGAVECNCKTNEEYNSIWGGKACSCHDAIVTPFVTHTAQYGCMVPTAGSGKCPNIDSTIYLFVPPKYWLLQMTYSRVAYREDFGGQFAYTRTFQEPYDATSVYANDDNFFIWTYETEDDFYEHPWSGRSVLDDIKVVMRAASQQKVWNYKLIFDGEGPCVRDNDCAGTLRCFDRLSGETIRSGYDISGISYTDNFCYDTSLSVACDPIMEQSTTLFRLEGIYSNATCFGLGLEDCNNANVVVDLKFWDADTGSFHENEVGYFLPMRRDGNGHFVVPKQQYPCPPGTFGSPSDIPNYLMKSCVYCPYGQYQDEFGQSACKRCSGDKYVRGQEIGAQSEAMCETCQAGKYAPSGSLGVCSDCPMGTYGAQGVCATCPDGTYAHMTGQTECTDCPGGTYGDGSYQYKAAPVPYQDTCEMCTLTMQTEQFQSYECRQTGDFSGIPDNILAISKLPWNSDLDTHDMSNADNTDTWADRICKPCTGGSYQDQTGQTSCKICSEQASLTGNNRGCEKCSAGFMMVSVDQACMPCGEGACPPGFYANEDSFTGLSCQQCPPGSVTDTLVDAGATSCTACPVNTFSNNAQVACKSCPNGYEAKDAAGEVVSIGATICTTCGAGQQSSSASAGCSSCPAGKHAATEATDTCIACPVGRFSEGAATVCAKCNNGYYAASTSSASCTKATEGYWSYSTNSHLGADYVDAHNTQTNCGTGYKCYYDSNGVPRREECSAGTYASSQTSTTCTDCVAPLYQDQARQTSCKTCANSQVPGFVAGSILHMDLQGEQTISVAGGWSMIDNPYDMSAKTCSGNGCLDTCWRSHGGTGTGYVGASMGSTTNGYWAQSHNNCRWYCMKLTREAMEANPNMPSRDRAHFMDFNPNVIKCECYRWGDWNYGGSGWLYEIVYQDECWDWEAVAQGQCNTRL